MKIDCGTENKEYQLYEKENDRNNADNTETLDKQTPSEVVQLLVACSGNEAVIATVLARHYFHDFTIYYLFLVDVHSWEFGDITEKSSKSKTDKS